MTGVACNLQRISRMLRNDLYILNLNIYLIFPKKKTNRTFTRNIPTTDFRPIFYTKRAR